MQTAIDTAPGKDTTSMAPNPTTPETPDSAYLIIPGESIGHVSLGMSSMALHDMMGKPDSGDAAMGKSLQFWVSKESDRHRNYLAVYTVNNLDGSGSPPEVKQVQVTSPKFQTESGIGTGKTMDQVREQFHNLQPLAYYTNEQKQQVYIFDDQAQGIAFEITIPDSLCKAITVHQKGKDVTETYLPIHPDMTRLKTPGLKQ